MVLEFFKSKDVAGFYDMDLFIPRNLEKHLTIMNLINKMLITTNVNI